MTVHSPRQTILKPFDFAGSQPSRSRIQRIFLVPQISSYMKNVRMDSYRFAEPFIYT